MDYLQIARETLGVEEKALGQLSKKLDGTFTEVVDLILNCKGRLVIGGIGKSGLVGKKWSLPLLPPAHRVFSYTRQKPFTAI